MADERFRKGLIASLIFSFLVLGGCETTQNLRTGSPPPHITTANPLTVMSFNIRLGLGQADPRGSIYHMNWGRELDGVIEAIRSVDPDIVGLQEVAGIDQITKMAKALNMNYAFEWHDTGTNRDPWWGVGILSKFKILSSKGVQISSGAGNTKHIVIATVDAGDRSLMFISVHKDKDLYDGSSITNILANVKNTKIPVVLIGDFNIIPVDRRLDPITERFLDTAEAVNTENTKWVHELGTFKRSGRRIDYVFAEKEHFKVIDAGLVPEVHRRASDHFAYFTKLTLKR